jgi:hypothetical protein
MKDYGALKHEQWGPNPAYGGRLVQRPKPQYKDVNTTLSPEQLNNVGVLSQGTKGAVSSRELGKITGLPGDVEGPKAVGSGVPDKSGVRSMIISLLAAKLGLRVEDLGLPEGLSGSYDVKSGDAKIGYEWPTN